MPIIDLNNRPQRPQGFLPLVIASALKYSDIDALEEEEETGKFNEGWQMLFDMWTYPWPIKPAKPFQSSLSWYYHHIKMVVKKEEWDRWKDNFQFSEDSWWNMMFEIFTYPEYQMDCKERHECNYGRKDSNNE